MPAWVTVLVGMLPGLIADVTALIGAIEGKPSPIQAASLTSLQSQIDAVFQAIQHAVATL